MEKTKPKIKIDSDKLVRINIIRTNDNRIMVDIKALELLISNHLIKLYNDEKMMIMILKYVFIGQRNIIINKWNSGVKDSGTKYNFNKVC